MIEEPKTEAVLYDTDAHQRVPLRIVQDGAVFEVAHHFLALDNVQIGLLLDAAEEERPDRLDNFWLEQIERLEGYDEAADTLEASFDERLSAVNDGLLLAVLVPQAAQGKPALKRTRQRYQLRAFFNGQFVDTSIALLNYNADQYRVWQRLEQGAYPIKFGDQKINGYSAGVDALYDSLDAAVNGYAGRVPLHHKELVVRQHFTGQSAAVLAKKS